MGKVYSCDKCEIASAASVFTFSDDLVLKITEGVTPPKEKEVPGQSRDLNDREWIEKIKCIDSVHSHVYNLNQDGFDRLLNQLETLLADENSPGKDEKEKIMKCYKDNPDCILKCNKAIEHFMDTVDIKRLDLMKKYKKAPDADSD